MTIVSSTSPESAPELRIRLTVNQYHQMIRQGILPEGAPVELLDGWLIHKDRSHAGEDPMTVGPEHAKIIARLGKLDPKMRRLGAYVRIQQPLTLPPFNEPEPDAAIVIGSEDDYGHRHPVAAEVQCAVEVADSSLADDRSRKQRIYADAGIPQYVIINLPERVVEMYTQPQKGKGRYGQSATLSPKQSVTFPGASGKSLAVPVKRLLP